MHRCTLRFYEELNDFLTPSKRKRDIEFAFWGHPSIKDVIESMGIPHSEVYLILANGESVGFEYHIKNEDRISVYPVFESIDITGITKIKNGTLRETKFVLDVHLGKLSRYLRIMGFDTMYRNDYSDEQIIQISLSEKRVILTRDSGILKHSCVERGYYVRNTDPRKQIKEIVDRFDLSTSIKLFSRCPRCNGKLKNIEKSTVENRIPEKTKKYCSSFKICSSCGKIYWRGGHTERIKRLFKELNII